VTLSPEFIREFLETIACYVMGSRTYELALSFEAQGLGWAYGDKPTFVLTRRQLPRIQGYGRVLSGDLARLVNERLKPAFRSIWFVGGGLPSRANVFGSGWPTKVRYSIVPDPERRRHPVLRRDSTRMSPSTSWR
jgi:hypothetical protein